MVVYCYCLINNEELFITNGDVQAQQFFIILKQKNITN